MGCLEDSSTKGSVTGRCNCEFTKTYPYAFGPRLGATYKLDDKTVVRAGWGITYSALSNWWYVTGGSSTLGVGFNSLNWTNPAFGEAALRLQDGLQYYETKTCTKRRSTRASGRLRAS